MLNYDPAKRPSASECLSYPFFQVKIPVPLNAPDWVPDAESILEEEEKKSGG